MIDLRFVTVIALATAVLSACAKPASDSTSQATSAPSSPAEATSAPGAPASGAPGGGAPASAAPGDGAPASPDANAPSAVPSAAIDVTASSLPAPSGTDVVSLNGSEIVAAFAAQSAALVNQADAVEYALLAADTSLVCEGIRKDFADDFAAHRNAAKYASFLTAHAKPAGLMSVDLPANLGQYDFNGKRFQIATFYGDGTKTFNFNRTPGCSPPWTTMPDKSHITNGIAIEVENAEPLHLYPLDANAAEATQKEASRYTLSEHLLFYPQQIARREDGRIGTVVHVTKMVLQQRPAGSPANAVPTVLYSVNLP